MATLRIQGVYKWKVGTRRRSLSSTLHLGLLERERDRTANTCSSTMASTFQEIPPVWRRAQGAGEYKCSRSPAPQHPRTIISESESPLCSIQRSTSSPATIGSEQNAHHLHRSGTRRRNTRGPSSLCTGDWVSWASQHAAVRVRYVHVSPWGVSGGSGNWSIAMNCQACGALRALMRIQGEICTATWCILAKRQLNLFSCYSEASPSKKSNLSKLLQLRRKRCFN